MKYFYAFLICFVCSLTTFAQQIYDTLMVNGVQRTFITYLPSNYNPQTETLPLVIVYHGLTMDNQTMTLTGFNQIADTARLIIMYPQGLTNSLGQTSWNNETALSSTADDIYFTNLMIDTAMLMYNIDLTRVYAAGVSMGSIMSYRLACDLNDRFAALGCVFGPMATTVMDDCNPSYSTPIIHFHGTNDGTVPYDSNPLPSLTLATETIAWWENQKTCNGSKDSIRVDDLVQDGLTTDRFIYNGCNADGSLELWRTNGGDHDYYIYPFNDFTHFIEAWKFMRKWQHPNPRNTVSTIENEVEITTIYPNPSTGSLNIETEEKLFKLTIFNLQGQKVYEGSNEYTLNLEQLSEGTYILQIEGETNSTVHRFVLQ